MKKLLILLFLPMFLVGCENEDTEIGVELNEQTEEIVINKTPSKEDKIIIKEKIVEEQNEQNNKIDAEEVVQGEEFIELVILLDTSSSMDGLIDQAKSQLWKMVDKFNNARNEKGEMPKLKLALYEYGNDSISMEDNYIRQVVPFTRDLDLVSEKLFSLTTNGGSEYCGAVIDDSVKNLDWSNEEDNLRIILIAGNEEFTQGSINYQEAISGAKQKDIIVNTIFCGNYEEGVQTKWADGAKIGNGKYFNIDQDKEVVHISSPQDERINELNIELNETYIYYGASGKVSFERQTMQDSESSKYGNANASLRIKAKSSKNYKNSGWDLVDALEEKEVNLEDVKNEELPENMQKMNKKEIKEYVDKQKGSRKKIQKQIRDLSLERDKFVAEKRLEMGGASDDTLDHVISEIITEELKTKNFSLSE